MKLIYPLIISFFVFQVSCKANFDVESKTNVSSIDENEVNAKETNKENLAVKLTVGNCVDPDLAKVEKGVKLMLCDGTLVEGKQELPSSPSDCSVDGSVGCVTTSSFVASEKSKILPINIKAGISIAGVTGTHPDFIDCVQGGSSNCVNKGNFIAVDQTLLTAGNVKSGVTVGGIAGTYVAVGTYPTIDKVALGEQYGPSGADFTGSKRATKICKNGKGITSVGGNTTTPYDDGETNGDDSVDDYQNNSDPWYTGADRSNCNETNFTDVTGVDPLLPDDAKRITASGSIGWTKIFQDDLTGLYFTNVLADDDGGATEKTWSESLNLCAGLNAGTAGNGWHLPTQKELMQLHINGISKLQIFGNTTQYFWSSSSLSDGTTLAWLVGLSNGGTSSFNKAGTRASFCVR